MNTIGPLARSVEDLTLALRLIAGPDSYQWEVPPVPLDEATDRPLNMIRFAWTDDFGGVPVTNDTRVALATLVEELRRRGCQIERRAPEGFDFTTAWESFDFIVTPTTPGVAFELGSKTADPLAMYMNDVCTVPMSLSGIPAISIPNGLSEGLPTGFQIAGPAFSENRILDAAHALEQAVGFDGSQARV